MSNLIIKWLQFNVISDYSWKSINNISNYNDYFEQRLPFIRSMDLDAPRIEDGIKSISQFRPLDLDIIEYESEEAADMGYKLLSEYPDLVIVEKDRPINIDHLKGHFNTSLGGRRYDHISSSIQQSASETRENDNHIVIAVIDSGVDINHKDLKDNIWINKHEIPNNGIDDDGNGYVDDVYGWNFVSNTNDVMDDNSHGTHCAGIALSQDKSVMIMSLKTLNKDGSGMTSSAIRAVNYAITMGADLTSNSWGGGGYSDLLKSALERFSGLNIAAAGNNAKNIDDNPHYPASYNNTNILSIAAVDNNNVIAKFSNYGLESVDLAAPGVNINSTIPDNQYGVKSGTSMATPYVAGVISSMIKMSRDKNLTLSNDDIKYIITKTLIPEESLEVKYHGVINREAALNVIEQISSRSEDWSKCNNGVMTKCKSFDPLIIESKKCYSSAYMASISMLSIIILTML